MGAADRFDRIEQRLAVLETLVRDLMAGRGELPQPPAPRPLSLPGDGSEVPLVPSPVLAAETSGASSSSQTSPEPPAPREAILSEEWLGRRGLLAVGVIFVVLAAAYLLKLSFERGWVSPLMRCSGGAAAGLGIGALGWVLHGRGYRTYGAALLGCGSAVVYLAVWAAARLYALLPHTPAVVALALVALSLAAIAIVVDLEALGATAALGALFAPIVVGHETGNVNLLLFYLGTMGAALGAVAVRRQWRIATALVALACFGIAGTDPLQRAAPGGLYLYSILGGSAGLYAGLLRGWWETRLLAFGGGWGILGIADHASTAHWPTLLGGMALSAPIWWRALTEGRWRIWPLPPGAPEESVDRQPALGETLYFYLSPILLGTALSTVARSFFDLHPGLVPALVALPYIVTGWSAVRRPFATVGAAALAMAAMVEWAGLPATWSLLGLAMLWAGLDHPLGRNDGRWYAAATLGLALLNLSGANLDGRPYGEPAFIGAWAMTLWWGGAVAAAFGAGLWRSTGEDRGLSLELPRGFWGLAGIVLLLGVTGELMRAAGQQGWSPETERLAGGLAVSAWWICFAAGCFLAGFWRGLRALRLTGFLVAGLALLKVVLVDLSTLDAFYRIGSALILGVVSLAVAWAYHRAAPRHPD